MLRTTLVCVFALAVGACQSPPQSPPAEPLDAFVVAVDAERWGVIIDKALDGVTEAAYANAALEASDALRTDTALKSGAARLIVLRNDVCKRGLLTKEECLFSAWPAWTLEPPSAAIPLETLDRRSAWLGATMARFTAVGCAAGIKASGEDLFCSVE